MPTVPPSAHNFKVEFLGIEGTDNDDEQRFNEVSGLTYEFEYESVKSGGENRFEYKLPKRTKYPNLVLKRGMLINTKLITWFKNALETYIALEVYDFSPADLMITLLDDVGEAVAIWNVIGAIPIKWAVADLNANENKILVETIEISYQFFERKL